MGWWGNQGPSKELKEEKRRIVETDLFGMAATLEKNTLNYVKSNRLIKEKKSVEANSTLLRYKLSIVCLFPINL